MELLAEIGHDLPGAVRIFPDDGELPDWIDLNRLREVQSPPSSSPSRALLKFSLAGVGLKFSLLRSGQRLTIPASGRGGDWIVKLPDPRYAHVPANEKAVMAFAQRLGVEVPPIMLVPRDELPELPDSAWPTHESIAYAIRRFDRGDRGELVHIEDLAQVRGVHPHDDGKYRGAFETVAAIAYRNRDVGSLEQVVRRLAVCVLVGNGDAHLKNWSLIYRNRRVPELSPAYDLVSTVVYDTRGGSGEEDLGLTLDRSRQFDRVRLSSFARMAERIGADPVVALDWVVDVVDRADPVWREIAAELVDTGADRLADAIGDHIRRRRISMTARAR
jgi:serine/threonine-protein kinase HipA